MPVALTIAGSDPSGGAGIQADLKTFHQFGVYGTAAITLLTVQNTTQLTRIECLPPDLIADQIRAVVADLHPAAAKTGALGNRETVEAIAALAAGWNFPLVIDPVRISKPGAALLSPDALFALRDLLIPRAFLITPNLDEAAALTGENDMRRAAEALIGMGAHAVLIKGGHRAGDAVDILLHEGRWSEFRAARIDTRHTHGTGCAYSAAITAGLALGQSLQDAVAAAKTWITEAIRTAPNLGRGSGPINYHA
ncbi:MAG: bifunctional hydroxymethylpyrimidine kinase/phosphomethylpyrimidine kinase [Acidobacteriota bacterium]|nr:bifunctional hydroxymethylpyrimidine kinase/phosphomethylpyrimidine kinase [Acidobacteriota bacterium]